MQNMLYLPVCCNLNAVYYFLGTLKAFEIFTSNRFAKIVEIKSFLKNLPWKNKFLAAENFS